MELDVTQMVEDRDEMPLLSGSQAELGPDAGRITWRNSMEYAARHPLLTTDEERQEARDYFAGFGAWSREEIDGWGERELQAIMAQDVASNIREMVRFETYEEYEAAAEEGRVSGNLYRGDDERYYFSL